jgi:hypothetical protein
VVLAWQRAERHWFSNDPHSTAHLDAFLNSPDLEDADQNRERRRLLDLIREPLLRWIPADTEWYRVDSLTDAEFGELRAIFSAPWTDLARDRNELLLVARRRNLALFSDPASWDTPILWGHQKQGPFTIIEGNNRLAVATGLPLGPKVGSGDHRAATVVDRRADRAPMERNQPLTHQVAG